MTRIDDGGSGDGGDGIVRITGSPAKLLMLMLLGVLMTASSAVVLVVADGPGLLIGLVGVAFFGFATAIAGLRLVRFRRPVVTLAPDGLRDLRISPDVIPWSAIEAVSTWSHRGTRLAVLGIDPDVERGLSLSRIARWTRGANRRLGADGLCISTQDLRIGHDELLREIDRRRAAAAPRVATPQTAAER